MGLPIVIAHHLIWTLYGWWLPNDPRGSLSRVIRNDILGDLGTIHFGRKRLQPMSAEIREFYREAAKRLKHEALTFALDQLSIVAAAFAEVIESMRCTCYACAVMPDHVHMLIRKHKHTAEEMIANFQDHSRLRLREAGLRDPDHPTWGGCGYKVFLDHPEEVRRIIEYIERNPVKIGWPAQAWPFVPAYDDWPLHEGHSPNSPYAKALRAVGRYP